MENARVFRRKIARCRSQETQGNFFISKWLGIYSPSWIVRWCDRQLIQSQIWCFCTSVIKKSEEELQTQLFRLSEMMKKCGKIKLGKERHRHSVKFAVSSVDRRWKYIRTINSRLAFKLWWKFCCMSDIPVFFFFGILREICFTYASEPQQRVWDFCFSLSDLSELRQALNFPSRARHLK